MDQIEHQSIGLGPILYSNLRVRLGSTVSRLGTDSSTRPITPATYAKLLLQHDDVMSYQKQKHDDVMLHLLKDK